ncbi:MAG: polysaccharide biosynthesis C-terminal domain-containing protein [Fischerella sp.]|uniref:MATE family efflux transporter n=1 Tax=Fischerella sp. TaxID=1191 RepID=UPI0018087105|nr:MATE family efflux transporter [Fischerella sp.]NWF58409.1 polysaccharide biosynthesis C-terminal domain-containing protein [Fischerella sp.]
MTSQKQSQITNEILQGNLIKLMFKLSTPSILGVLMLSLNSFIDALFAGRFIGENALAGISLAMPLTSIVNGFAALIGVGSASVLSRAIGTGDVKTQSKMFGNLIILSIIISSFITFIGYIFGQELIALMGGNGEVASEGTKYLKTYVLGSIFLILGEACGEVINSEGNIRLNTLFNLIFVSVNILLNYIFITVYNWGTQGIALATVMAMVVSSILNLSYFITGKSIISVHLKKIVIAIDLLTEIFSIGVSSLFYPVMILVQEFVIFNLISDYGKNIDIAFFGATMKVDSLMVIPIVGLAQALQPVIGINYGANNYRRVKNAYLIFAIIGTTLLLFIWLPLQIVPTVFLNMILPGINFTIEDVINFRILNILIPIWPLAYCSNTLFLSIGKPKVVLLALFLKSIVFNVPMMIFFSSIIGLRGIYIGSILADFIFMLVVFWLTAKEFGHLSKLNCT